MADVNDSEYVATTVDYITGLNRMLEYMFPLKDSFVVHNVKTFFRQVSGNDCGLFSLAYVWCIVQGKDPSLICFNQSSMSSK